MRLAFSNAIRVSTVLNVDADLRPRWQEMLDNLASPSSLGRGRRPANPTGGDAGAPGGAAPATRPGDGNGGGGGAAGGGFADGARRGNRPFGAFVYGGPGAIPANEPDAQLKSRFLGFNALGSFIDVPGIGGAQIFRNRLRLREGPGAIDAEHLGGLTAGIHSTLLDSTRDESGQPQIEVFTNVWPRSWDCAFELLARGGFLVTTSLKKGQIEFVCIDSQLGGKCRIKSPWPRTETTFYRNGKKAESAGGDVLTFDTAKGESILLIRSDATPEGVGGTIPGAPEKASSP
jgi:hypothetical protein